MAAPTVQQHQAEKIAWLESMLDTTIVAYESHRNALENIYAQLAQWQQPPHTGCIHIAPNDVEELLRDINDVLDQCALQLQPFNQSNENNSDTGAPAYSQENSQRSPTAVAANAPVAPSTTYHTPSEHSRVSQSCSAAAADASSEKPKKDPQEASARTVSDAPSRATNRSGTNPPPRSQQQQQQSVPRQRTASATPSQASSVPPSNTCGDGHSNACKAELNLNDTEPTHADLLMSDGHSVQSHHCIRSEAKDNDVESGMGQESNPFESEEASVQSSVCNNNGGTGWNGSEVPSSTPNARGKPQGPASQRGVPDISPAQLDKTGRRPSYSNQQPTDTASTQSGPSQASSARRPQHLQQKQQENQSMVLRVSSTPLRPLSPAQVATDDEPRQRMQTCYHHQRIADLAVTPWPNLNNGRDSAAAISGSLPPPAAARAEVLKDELLAEPYSALKERGTSSKSSLERQAVADVLEKHTQAVEAAKEAVTYLPPDDEMAEGTAILARVRQPMHTSSYPSTTPSVDLNESQRSRNQRRQPRQQQQQRSAPSNAPRSVAAVAAPGNNQQFSRQKLSRPHSQFNQSFSAVGDDDVADRSVHQHLYDNSHPYHQHDTEGMEEDCNNGDRNNAVIPRRRGSSAAMETDSERSSTYPSYVEGKEPKHNSSSQRSASKLSRCSHPPAQQQQQPAARIDSTHKGGSHTPSQIGSTIRSISANPNGASHHESVTSTPRQRLHQQQQQQQQQPSSVPASLPVKRQLNTDAVRQQQQMDASQVGSVGLVHTPGATPQRYSSRDFSATAAQHQQQQPTSLSYASSKQQQNQEAPLESSSTLQQQKFGTHRPLRTAVPRRTTPRAYDSSQSEDAIFHGRVRGSPARPPVRTDSPNALRYMDREDSQLRQRKEEELAEIHNAPHTLQRQQQEELISGLSGSLKITDGSAASGSNTGENQLTVVPSKNSRSEEAKLTAVEEQLLAERTVLHNQLEKMQMEVSIATSRNKEWGNEQRYAQLNARMNRVMEDLDRVEKELRTVRTFDREARSQPASKAR